MLSKETIIRIKKSTYEVVVKKLEEKGVSYEKPLPWELLPFHIRNDNYHSIGTAFSIDGKTFISGAHVFRLGEDSQFDRFFLRDNDGKVFPINDILKYSQDKDFIIFSLKGNSSTVHLDVNPNPEIDEVVYAVGNALGQGVVIRDGLYTSKTPEEAYGEWKWIRFSAATSNGNSGGPLLDKEGAVIGIVLRRSQNENLNFALPIKEVLDSPANLATRKSRVIYGIENMDMRFIDRMDSKIKLPMSILDLRKKLVNDFDQFGLEMQKKFLGKYSNNIFPKGKSSLAMLHNTFSAIFPDMISKGEDGNWNGFYPEKRETANLGDNGSLTYGQMNGTFYIQVKKPDTISYSTFQNMITTELQPTLGGAEA